MQQRRKVAPLRSVIENPDEIQRDTKSKKMMQRSSSSRVFANAEILMVFENVKATTV